MDDLIPTEDELAAVGGGAHGASGGGSMPAGGGLVATASPITPIARKASTLLPPPDHVPPCTRLREIVVTQLFRVVEALEQPLPPPEQPPPPTGGLLVEPTLPPRRPPRRPRFNGWRMAVDGCCGGCARRSAEPPSIHAASHRCFHSSAWQRIRSRPPQRWGESPYAFPSARAKAATRMTVMGATRVRLSRGRRINGIRRHATCIRFHLPGCFSAQPLIFQTRRCPVRRAASPRRALPCTFTLHARLRCSPNL